MKKVIINASIFIVTICTQKSYSQDYTFVGEDAGKYAKSKNNTGVGYRALYSDPALFCSPSGSCAFGYKALENAECASWNCAIGFESMLNTIGGYSNSAVGYTSLHENISGGYNSAFGKNSLYYNKANNNNGFGYNTLFSNVDGEFNTAIGSEALRSNKASNNTALGYRSAYFTTTGFSNLSLGVNSLYTNTTGYYNTAVGNAALYANTTGYYNVAAGPYALGKNTTGRYNIAIGFNAGNALIGGSNNNTFIGTQADATLLPLSNSTAIGNGAKVNASNKVRIGNSSVTVIGGAVNWSVTSAPAAFINNKKENVPGLHFINKLKPVTYNVDAENFAKSLGMADSVSYTEKEFYRIASKTQFSGLMPEEVEMTAKEIGYNFDGIKPPQNEKDNYSIAYADFVPSLIKAVQELSLKNDEKAALINEQQKINGELDKRIEKLEALLVSMQNGSKALVSNSSDYSLIPVTPSLQQNQPNPFNQNTIIKYSIPQQTKSAVIKITSVNGVEMKSITITQKGNGQIEFNTNTLPAGIYQYNLYVDGKMAGSKKMEIIR